MSVRTVALIGAGSMGAPMAMNIHKSGFELTVCDLNPQARARFEQAGCRTTDRAADCADCDAVIVVVATPEQARAVVFGDGGLVGGLNGRTPFLVLMGTVAPETVREFQDELAPLGVRVVDAPVSGGVVKAREGTLAIIMGGRKEDCDALRPLMQAMGDQIFHCGALGAGQATKIINNLVGIANLLVAAEAYRIAIDNGSTWPTPYPCSRRAPGAIS